MASNPTTIIDELVAAARGMAYLVVGDRRAAGHFDFSRRGLYGSFIASLTATLFSLLFPVFLGIKQTPGTMTQALVMIAMLYALQIAFSALVLNRFKRLDGLVPYIVADNWAHFFLSVLATLVVTLGVGNELALLVVAILVIAVQINISRLLVTLSPMQIVLFLAAQVVGVLVGFIIIGMFMPLPAGAIPPV